MNYIATILILFCTSLGLHGQDDSETATQQIKGLKKGYLVVRLKKGEMQASALEKAGSKKEALEYLQKQQTENLLVIAAFHKHYKFCPVYFCYTSSSQAVRSGNLKGILLNDQLQTDSTLVPAPGFYLTAEFGFTDRQQREGLLMMTSDFQQLKSPFPFLVTKFAGVAHKRTTEEMVATLDMQLTSFLQKR
jgi:hypothetical protein